MDNVSEEMKSRPSERIKLRFVNYSYEYVEIYWIDFTGSWCRQEIVPPKKFLDVDTFTQHVWTFKGLRSQNLLMANNTTYYFIAGNFPFLSPDPGKRHIIYITPPFIAKLRTTCINYLTNILKLKKCSDVKTLEIPTTLQSEILRKIHKLRGDSNQHTGSQKLCDCDRIS